ncbi:hypothetical protein C8R43DRAFT_871690 [Mycena crocata]|nr:hypothetical protein C8R43DRAFT_871690 [Mycena crocata]
MDRQEQAFEAGTDFIPLVDDSDVEYERRRETLRRRRAAHSPSPPSAPPPPLPPQDSRIREGVQENGNGHSREWDRRKRRYDMVFDPSDGYQNKKQRTDAKSRLVPWVEHVHWEGCENTAELFHREVEGFVNWISPTPQEDEIRRLVVAIISYAVTPSFPDASVFPFGSYATKLYLPLGDIDLVIRSPLMAYADKHVVLIALAATIRRSGITNKVTIIAKAKVPIVKFVTNDEYGRFAVDLSINQENGIVAGHIINGFLQQFGSGSRGGTCLALRAFVLLTKLFVSQRGMNEVYTGSLGSYAIVCLVISFLQMHPKIRHGQIDANANLGVLVVEFFELYRRWFHYEEVGISLREGGMKWCAQVRRAAIDRGSRGAMYALFSPLLSGACLFFSLCSAQHINVRKNLAGAHEILIATIYLRAGILEARRGGQSFNLRDRYEPGDMSILSRVLGVTQETLNNRALVKEVYEKQTLHRLVGVSPLTYLAPTQASAANATNLNGNGKAKPKSNGKVAFADADHHRRRGQRQRDEWESKRKRKAAVGARAGGYRAERVG